jgi:hypothetical protein
MRRCLNAVQPLNLIGTDGVLADFALPHRSSTGESKAHLALGCPEGATSSPLMCLFAQMTCSGTFFVPAPKGTNSCLRTAPSRAAKRGAYSRRWQRILEAFADQVEEETT